MLENTRVVDQKKLERFREEAKDALSDPTKVVMRMNKLPLGLLKDPYQKARPNVLTVESFSTTFGKKALRKRPRLSVTDSTSLASHTENAQSAYDESKDTSTLQFRRMQAMDGSRDYIPQKSLFAKGQSKRIWGELYKVLDASDVVVQVLDARDPMGTRCRRIEQELKSNERRHKHMVFLLNKCDLIPVWATRRWVRVLGAEYPTIAMHSSITNPFGKGALIQLLRQFAHLHQNDRKQISVGFVGYPNVGKSSVINTLKAKKVCNVAPIPGETKVWKYITLFKRLFLVDCPGVVYHDSGQTETDAVLKGVVRVEMLDEPAAFIAPVLERMKPEYLRNAYQINSWTDAEDFLAQLAQRTGKLLPGGDPDRNSVAKMVLNDWQRGKIPFFNPPPFDTPLKPKESSDAPSVQQVFDRIHVKQRFAEVDLEPTTEQARLEDRQMAESERHAVDWDRVKQDDEDEDDEAMPGQEFDDEEDEPGASSTSRKRKAAAQIDPEEVPSDDEEEPEEADDDENSEADGEEEEEGKPQSLSSSSPSPAVSSVDTVNSTGTDQSREALAFADTLRQSLLPSLMQKSTGSFNFAAQGGSKWSKKNRR